MKPTLLIMAAGMGSRYGSLKQLDGVGPSNETILDYSIYDAQRAGFGKVVFVIRKSFEKEFCEHVVNTVRAKGIECECVFQELDKLPSGYTLPALREKPWGTAHAILMAKDVIKEPFVAINADDFYSKEAFDAMYSYLSGLSVDSNEYAMIGYQIMSTLSESGSVSRGVCQVDDNGYLISTVERKKISFDGKELFDIEPDGNKVILTGKEVVSMNFWGFTPTFFDHIEKSLRNFLDLHIEEEKSELYIPTVVYELLQSKTSSVKVINCGAKWFGVTYKEDRPTVVQEIQKLVDKGTYPSNLY